MKEKKEMIVCAAIMIEYYDGYNKMGTRFIGVDYKRIRNDAVYEMYHDDYKFLSEVEGFITNGDRFVDAVEARKIAIDAGQFVCMRQRIADLEAGIESKWVDIRNAGEKGAALLKRYIEDDRREIESIKAAMFDGSISDKLRPGDIY